MNILLIGYGKMGQELEKLALKQGHRIAGIVDVGASITQFAHQTDVAIEFTTPHAVVDNIMQCFELQIPIVTGTTGWLDSLPLVSEQCKLKHGSLLYASNFSIGMNIFFYLNKFLAELMNHFSEYQPSLNEIHHTQKIDKPSGTALQLLQDLIATHNNSKEWHFADENTKKSSIPVNVERIGDVKGVHQLLYECESDILSIQHEAKNRIGFANGAILSAAWLLHRKGIFSFDDFFSQFINK